jgi:hypothetical protein
MSPISIQSPLLVRRLLEQDLNPWINETGDPGPNTWRQMHIFIFDRL